jgi:hypothetical protein
MVGQLDPRDPGDYDRVRARIDEVMDAAQRETVEGRGYRASLAAREKPDGQTSRWLSPRLALTIVAAVVVLGAIGLLMQR